MGLVDLCQVRESLPQIHCLPNLAGKWDLPLLDCLHPPVSHCGTDEGLPEGPLPSASEGVSLAACKLALDGGTSKANTYGDTMDARTAFYAVGSKQPDPRSIHPSLKEETGGNGLSLGRDCPLSTYIGQGRERGARM